MPHKLFVKLKMKSPLEYKRFLQEDEIVSGKTTEFAVIIKNIGEKSTPKGHMEMELETPLGLTSFTKETEQEIPVIEPNEDLIFKWKMSLVVPGLWFLTVKFKFDGQEKIEYFQREKGPPDHDKWITAFYVVDRHQLDLHSRLESFLQKKEA